MYLGAGYVFKIVLIAKVMTLLYGRAVNIYLPQFFPLLFVYCKYVFGIKVKIM